MQKRFAANQRDVVAALLSHPAIDVNMQATEVLVDGAPSRASTARYFCPVVSVFTQFHCALYAFVASDNGADERCARQTRNRLPSRGTTRH